MTYSWLRTMVVAVSSLVLPVAGSEQAWSAPMPTAFTYQGQLKNSGLAVDSSGTAFRFALFDAAVGGTPIGATIELQDVVVSRGLFSVQLDFGAAAFDGQARWLQISVFGKGLGWVALSPRQPITPGPYAVYASKAGLSAAPWIITGDDLYYTAGRVGIGIDSPASRLHVVDSSTSPAALIRNNAGGGALRVEAASGTAMIVGGGTGAISAWAYSNSGTAILGGCDAPSGAGTGVYGQSNGTEGKGVIGYATAGSGSTIGVQGVSDSTGGFGVYGLANATTGLAEGGRFISNAGNGRGVYARSTHTSGQSYGVYARADSTSGRALYGEAMASTGSNYAVLGRNQSTSGIGVAGEALATSGTTFGVHGSSAGGTGSAGVRGEATGLGGVGGLFTSLYGLAARFEGAGGITVDHPAGAANTAGLTVNTTGTEEPVGLRVNVNAAFGRLAEYMLSNAAGYFGTAFSISADSSGYVLDVNGSNTNSEYPVLRVRSAGTGSAVHAQNSRENSDTPAIRGYHVSTTSNWGIGVRGDGGYKGVEGVAGTGDGSGLKFGVYGSATGVASQRGVQGNAEGSGTKHGVYGSASGPGTNYGVYGSATGGTSNYAGYFAGNTHVTGTLSKGGGSFKIDHPLDPENKYLSHSFVESPDMMNVYNGNVVLDDDGQATVTLPAYFEALNRDFRYQLTCIGGFAQVYVAEEVRHNQFRIAGGSSGLKVSWQVTGVRQDPFAEANRIVVEVDKPESERGTYLHAQELGKPAEQQLDLAINADEQVTKSEKDRDAEQARSLPAVQ